ncbi:MAG: glucose 1-dehydrogenase [Acidobacteria bacterium]|nr:glucose 1-dehydrogenase [Acidobacteriota bacterium]MBI3470737.1 glucose 1-dehydrogenase [Candidatus Solibacter usitatus]
MTPQQLFTLEGKVAVVLGGTSGIGQAIARGYAQAGAITIASSRDRAKVDAMAGQLEALGSQTLRQTSDVQDRASLEALCAAAVAAFGHVDVLVVTSGALKKAPTVDLSEEDWNRVIDINLNGTFRANQVFGRQMIRQQSGAIINTCSMTSFVSFNEVAPYAASKAGVLLLTRSLACEWARHHVRVNAIAPGVFRTPLNTAALDIPERLAAITARTPMGRVGRVEELVGAAVFLASEAASFVTGETIAVDGGFLAKGI